MKTATLPPLRVEAELRKAAESVLREGETLSSFVEQAVRDNVVRRRMQKAFLDRGLAAREEARRSGDYISAEAVLADLDSMLKAKRDKRRSA